MKKILRRAAAVLTVFLCLFLAGCQIVSEPEKLLSPPSLSGDMRPISEALRKGVKGNYTLVYPSSGDMRSPIVLRDIDSDGTLEAFAFYSTVNGGETVLHIKLIRKTDGKWKAAAECTVPAGGVEKIEFCDLDADGNTEILVGWEIYGSSEKKVGVYSVRENTMTERVLQQYTAFLCCDIDLNGKYELFLQYLDAAAATNTASLYSFTENGINKTAGCAMDGTVKSVGEPVYSTLSSGAHAIFIDEEKGGGMITEVLFLENGELKNPLLDPLKKENTSTLRSTGISAADINGDGIIELPVATEAPAADSAGDRIYYTNWCDFDGEILTVKQISLTNTADGYRLDIPARLVNNIAVLKDIENHSRTFFAYDKETATVGKKLFTVTAYTADGFKKAHEKNPQIQKITSEENAVFAAEIFSYEVKNGIRIEFDDLKEMFKTTSD